MNPNIEICNTFNKYAQGYEQAAKVQGEIGARLFERLDYLTMQPRYVLDLGCGTGVFSLQLKKRYPKATIISLDSAFAMLKQTKKKQGWRKKWPLIQADMAQTPFADGVFDLIFANQAIHWCSSLSQAFAEFNRILAPNGCLLFSTLGPDTFKELKQAWRKADHFAHANDFLDMHDVGDILLNQQFLDPVVDMELLTVHYSELSQLVQNIKAQGVRNMNSGRNKGLTGKKAWQAFYQAYQPFVTPTGKFPLTYEIIYGHAWKGMQRRVGKGTETFISVSDIQRRTPSP